MTLEVWNVEQATECLSAGVGFHIEGPNGCYIYDEPSEQGFGPFVLFYEAIYGPVPDGMAITWLCGNGRRGCVRPQHMDVAPEGSRMAQIADPALELTGPTLAAKILDEREARGMTRPEFATELRVSASTLKSWEEGTRYPDADMLRWLGKQLGWDGKQRTYIVTFVTQRVVDAPSSGAAMRQVWDDIERITASPRKAAVVSVKPWERRKPSRREVARRHRT